MTAVATAVAAGGGALGAVLALCARSRAALLAGIAVLGLAIVAAAIAFAGELGDGLDDVSLDVSPAIVVGLLAVAAVLVAGAAALVRHPAAVVPLLLAAAPFRPPLDPDPDAALLVTLRPDALVGYHLPLYGVLAAAVLALAWRLLRGERASPIPRSVAYPGAALIALTALSLLWSDDREEGLNEVLLFWLPYALLVPVVAHAALRDWTPRALGWIVVGLGCVLGLVGLAQAIAGEVFFATPALAEVNATTGSVRTTSLFEDPSIYGRHLVVAMAVVLCALWAARLRLNWGLALLALLAAALFLTYSQSSMLALACAAVAVALLAGDRGARRASAALIAAAALGAGTVLAVAVAGGDAADLTRNRSALVTDTAAVFVERPLLGVGVGAQPVATRAQSDDDASLGQSTSHTTPLTIGAELGLAGLAAYVALLVGAALVLRELHRRDPGLALGLAAVLVVLFVHALIYEGFFEAATSWGAIALGCAALRAPPSSRAGEAAGP